MSEKDNYGCVGYLIYILIGIIIFGCIMVTTSNIGYISDKLDKISTETNSIANELSGINKTLKGYYERIDNENK